MTVRIQNEQIIFNDSTTMTSGQQAAKAFCIYNPQNNTIYNSHNISSVSGDTINFTSQLSDANYAPYITPGPLFPPDPYLRHPVIFTRTTTSFRMGVMQPSYVTVTIFR
jgi:hypothetical protein